MSKLSFCNRANMASATLLSRVPAEIRRMILVEALSAKVDFKHLMAAFRTSKANVYIYHELLAVYYHHYYITINNNNYKNLDFLSNRTKASIHLVRIELTERHLPPVKKIYGSAIIDRASQTKGFTQHIVQQQRSLIEPSLNENLTPFPNLKSLNVRAWTITQNKWHQVVGTIQTIGRDINSLRTIIVESPNWQFWQQSQMMNDEWVDKLNHEFRLPAQLAFVSGGAEYLANVWIWEGKLAKSGKVMVGGRATTLSSVS